MLLASCYLLQALRDLEVLQFQLRQADATEKHQARTHEKFTKKHTQTNLLQAASSAVKQSALDARLSALAEEEEAVLAMLPGYVKKLISGYELRCFHFEIFESFRKLALVGAPIAFPPGRTSPIPRGASTRLQSIVRIRHSLYSQTRPSLLTAYFSLLTTHYSLPTTHYYLLPGSTGQATFALLICFVTFGAYAGFAPYKDVSDDHLSQICQAYILSSE